MTQSLTVTVEGFLSILDRILSDGRFKWKAETVEILNQVLGHIFDENGVKLSNSRYQGYALANVSERGAKFYRHGELFSRFYKRFIHFILSVQCQSEEYLRRNKMESKNLTFLFLVSCRIKQQDEVS